ncbi:hypothetical protein NQ318_017080 [Aromia moschata]|uniref:Uncharacterized protein n=1 Tax=Aromia moschata TaxID=1265417 RepID=A0AAV8XMB9_9CUCU|nr:hypothetical protein NQ318_017080 [Aromia moschata]
MQSREAVYGSGEIEELHDVMPINDDEDYLNDDYEDNNDSNIPHNTPNQVKSNLDSICGTRTRT